MADYRGATAPALVLYSDGQYLVQQSPGEASWYEEKEINKEDVTVLLKRIEKSGFFSVSGDGKMWEEDPIYQLPDDFVESQGAGTLSLEAEYGDLSKQVTIYIPYRSYLVPEIAETLQILEEYIPRNMKPYRPKHWVAWVSREDPCPYDLQFRPWPDGLPNIQAFLNGAPDGQLVLQSNSAVNFYLLIGSKPNTFFDKEGEFNYYIYTRPLLPHELPSDFCDDSC